MLEQEELIGNLLTLAHLDEFLLNLHPVFVGNDMKAAELASAHGRER